MSVTTRNPRAAQLCESVLEQPLLLREVLGHLSSSDIVRLKMSGGVICREERFLDTINNCLAKRHSEYLKEEEKKRGFMKTVKELLLVAEQARGFANKVQTMNDFFDHLVENNWFVNMHYFEQFICVVEDKLIETMFLWPVEYARYSLYYMEKLFGTKVECCVQDTGEPVEYIMSRSGEMIVL